MDIDEPVRDHQDVFFDALSNFVVDNANSARDMVQALNEEWTSTTWDATTDTAAIDFSLDRDRSSLAMTLGNTSLHNMLLHRTLLCLADVQLELQTLAEEGRQEILPPFCVFGADVTIRDDDAARGFGRLLPHIMDLWTWHRRVTQVVVHMMRQLSSLFHRSHERDKMAPFQGVRVPSVWNALYDCLGAVVMVEDVLRRNEVLHKAATIFSRVMSRVKDHPDKHETANIDYVEQFVRLLAKLDRETINGGLLSAIAKHNYDCPETTVTMNESLFTMAGEHLVESLQLLTELIGNFRERKEERRRVAGVIGFFSVFNVVFDARLSTSHAAMRKDLAVRSFALQRVCPLVPIYGDASLKVGQWLATAMPGVINANVKEATKETLAAIKEMLADKRKKLPIAMRQYRSEVAEWATQMNSTFSHDRTRTRTMLKSVSTLIIRGVFLAQHIQRLVNDLFLLHMQASEAMNRSMVESVMSLIALLMTIRNTTHARTSTLSALHGVMVQSFAYEAQKELYELQQFTTKKLRLAATAGSGVSLPPAQAEALTDQLVALQQAQVLLGQPATRQTLACLDLALAVAFRRRDLLEEFRARAEVVHRAVVFVRDLSTFQRRLIDATDCSFMFWQQQCLPVFFKAVHERPLLVDEATLLFQALHDAHDAMLRAKHDTPQNLIAEFCKTVEETFEAAVVEPLLETIETQLRLHTHAGVLGQPYKKLQAGAQPPKDNARLALWPPIRFFSKVISVREMLEDKLDSRFYELNALNPNDWRIYDEMRNLAQRRYGLQLLEGHLPGSIVDQGLDVLVVTKNIHVFIAHYAYNLNEQMFVQRPAKTDLKHLNLLHIRHVVNSIRTHGTGIMNTTVHYVFQCLRRKLALVYDFLNDDVIRSRLMKEIKHFEANKEQLQRRVPYERVSKFITDMRKLGEDEQGATYLDQFRQVVSEIGNALGYVRMVRSGGLRALADAAVLIPDLEDIPFLEQKIDPNARRDADGDSDSEASSSSSEDDSDYSDEEEEEEDEGDVGNVSETTKDSVRVVDKVITHMMKKLSEGSDYFRLLRDGLAKKFGGKHEHLKNFYMIVPPMCVSFIEMIVSQKEKLMKKNKEGLFCDDGFALGCSFLLALFGSESHFDSLHWFDSAHAHLMAKRNRENEDLHRNREAGAAAKKVKNEYGDDAFATDTIQLTIAVLEQSIMEYRALHHSFNSCRVFFSQKRPDEKKADEDEEDEEE